MATMTTKERGSGSKDKVDNNQRKRQQLGIERDSGSTNDNVPTKTIQRLHEPQPQQKREAVYATTTTITKERDSGCTNDNNN